MLLSKCGTNHVGYLWFHCLFFNLSNASANAIQTLYVDCFAIYLLLRIIRSVELSPFLTPQWSWSCSRTFISRYYKTGKDKRSTLNMATRSMLRTVLNSFAGLNFGATNVHVNCQKRINVPRISAATIQCRGIRQGDVFQEMWQLAPELG